LRGGERSVHLLEDEPVAITEEAPVVLNAGASGYYRSRYGVTETKALADHVDELDAAERAALLSDGWALLLSSQISAEQFLTIGAGLGNLDEPTPWGTLASAVAFIDRALPKEQLPVLPPRFARSSNRSIGASGGTPRRARASSRLSCAHSCFRRSVRRAPMRRSRPKR